MTFLTQCLGLTLKIVEPNVSNEWEAAVGLPCIIPACLPVQPPVLSKQHLFILVFSSLLAPVLKVHGCRYPQKGKKKEHVYSSLLLLSSLERAVFKASTSLLNAFILIARYNNTEKIFSNSLDSFYWLQMKSKNISLDSQPISYLCYFTKCLTLKHGCIF